MNKSLLRLGGIAGIGVGLFILPFAFINEAIGGLFAPEVLHGESVEPWLNRVSMHPGLAQFAITLPIIGFSFMLVVGLVLYQFISEKSWTKNLALAGYIVGVPLAVSTFVSTTSLIHKVIQSNLAESIELINQAKLFLTFELNQFMLINFFVGPLLIIIVGNTCISLAALHSASLPRWLCRWGIINGVLMLIGLFAVISPILEIAQIGGPLTMLWFITTGVFLLKKSLTFK